jgi:hypothetical protein
MDKKKELAARTIAAVIVIAIALAALIALATLITLGKHPAIPPAISVGDGTIPDTAPAPETPTSPAAPKHFFETKAMDSALAAYHAQWERIKQAPNTAIGQPFTWTARVLSVTGQRVAVGWPGRVIEYNTEEEVPPPPDLSYEQLLEYNGMVSRGLPQVYKDDIVCLIGTFTTITPAGSLEFNPKTLINYGHK